MKDKIGFEGKLYSAVVIKWKDEEGNWENMIFAEDALYDALFDTPEAEEPKNDTAKAILDRVDYFTCDAHNADNEADFINALCEENSYYKEIFNTGVVRRCDVCGKIMQYGYMANYFDFHACCDECLIKSYDGDENEMNLDCDGDTVFYADFETPFYDN